MPKLTPCPREDCTADVRHWHNHAGATFACTNTKRKWCRKQHIDVAHPCHLPHVPASSQVKTADNPAPIVLPTVKEVREAIIAGTKLGGWMPHTAAQAVLDLIASRVRHWVPVEPGTVIKAGTRVRRPYLADADWVEHVCRPEGAIAAADWFIDPATVPAEPEDQRIKRAHAIIPALQRVKNVPLGGDLLPAALEAIDAIDALEADR